MKNKITKIFDEENKMIAESRTASPEFVEKILSAPVTENGRSVFKYFRLTNGDLILGVYPCGDMYFETESDENYI